MKRSLAVLLGVGLIASGCAVYEIDGTVGPSGGHSGDSGPYVDSYVHIPYAIRFLIADRVAGYELPPMSRYSYDLYPYSYVKDAYNMPCYVRTDFNGDYTDDYAFLFSTEEWCNGKWELTTKMLVAVSTCCGYELSLDMELGTVTAPLSSPVEEYWAIGLMRAGTHSVATNYGGLEVVESVTLDEDGFFLKSLDGSDNALFYVVDNETYEMAWEHGALSKRKAQTLAKARAGRVIELKPR